MARGGSSAVFEGYDRDDKQCRRHPGGDGRCCWSPLMSGTGRLSPILTQKDSSPNR